MSTGWHESLAATSRPDPMIHVLPLARQPDGLDIPPFDYVQIPLTRGLFALVDVADEAKVLAKTWYALRAPRTWYAASSVYRNGRSRTIYLHKFLIDAPMGIEIDHMNGDGLDNRRHNLRLATHQQNSSNQKLSRVNTSGYRGVTWNRRRNCWSVKIKVNQQNEHLGCFRDAEIAAYARDLRAVEAFGSFAPLNLLKQSDDLGAIRARIEAARLRR